MWDVTNTPLHRQRPRCVPKVHSPTLININTTMRPHINKPMFTSRLGLIGLEMPLLFICLLCYKFQRFFTFKIQTVLNKISTTCFPGSHLIWTNWAGECFMVYMLEYFIIFSLISIHEVNFKLELLIFTYNLLLPKL